MSDGKVKFIRPSFSRHVFVYCSMYAILFCVWDIILELPPFFVDSFDIVLGFLFGVIMPLLEYFAAKERFALVIDAGQISGPTGHHSQDREIIRPKRITFPISEIDRNKTLTEVLLFSPFSTLHVWNKEGDSIAIWMLFFWPSQVRTLLSEAIFAEPDR